MTRRLRRPARLARTGATAAVTTVHTLATSAWAVEVGTLERAIDRFAAERPVEGGCQVIMFEVEGDEQLHVNVIHGRQHPHVAVRGWSGPGDVADGWVYNRRFADGPAADIVRHIRTMVFA